MDWLVGAKPPVMKPDMEIHRPLNRARTGSMPEPRHSANSSTVATAMTMSDMRLIRRTVFTMFGSTCSLRPSEEYRPEVALPRRPSERATTIRPKPPIRCMMKRHMLSAAERCSRSMTSVTPVVVRPETASISASRYEP